MKKACIFCASSPKISASYFEAAERLAQLLVANKWGIVYGGGSVGLMGAVADAALKENGEVIGVIPSFMVKVEWQHNGVKDMRQTETMAQRKRLMIDLSDAIIVLPGSTGTFDEFFEAMADKKLGLYTKPLILLNTNGFYDNTIAQLNRMVKDNFMTQNHLDVLTIANTPEDVIRILNSGINHTLSLNDAAVK